MKQKIKPAAKIFFAALIVALLFGAKWLFYDSKQPKQSPAVANEVDTTHTTTLVVTQSVTGQSITVQQEVVSTNTVSTVVNKPVIAPVESNVVVVKKEKSSISKEKKKEDRENLNVNY